MPSFIHIYVIDLLAIPCLNEPLLGPKLTSDILSHMSGGEEGRGGSVPSRDSQGVRETGPYPASPSVSVWMRLTCGHCRSRPLGAQCTYMFVPHAELPIGV